MKDFFASFFLAYFVGTLANSSVNSMKSDQMRKAQCHINYISNFYAGPNSKKLEQQLAEIKEEIKAMKRKEPGRNATKGPNCSNISQQLVELKKEILEEIMTIKRNTTEENEPNCAKISQQLVEIKKEILEEIKAIKRNETGGNGTRVYKNCAEVYESGDKISGVYKIDPDGLGEFEVFCDQKTAGGGWTVFQKRQDGSVDFFRGWNDYKRGFGNLNGTARDALTPHRGMLFTTKDGDNDKLSGANCAMIYKGAWWYYYCDRSDLNGLYRPSKGNIRGMYWWSHKPETTRSEMKIRPKNF